ncbi:retinal dehydrogenase 2-like [Oppia nitens]|uniref:retinal dehydrogenase 2-like n=1 Tax=Oppia nitens TaxID=1686743 RepID=UPI0023DB9DE9|nr:retinal dehydrogenase 2-like [Oppia nitens]
MSEINRNPEIKYTQLFINNEWLNSENGNTFETINPTTEQSIARIQSADNRDIDKAVKAARLAFKRGSVWRTIDASERGRLLYRLSDLIDRDADYLAELTTLDTGAVYMSVSQSIVRVVKIIRYYAGWSDKFHGKTVPADNDNGRQNKLLAITRLEPIGVCGQILTWNTPLFSLAGKLGPALATGNVVVVKPAEQSTLAILYVASLILEAGFPAGVVNIVPGSGQTAGRALAEHMDVDKVFFNGSTRVGRLVQLAVGQSNGKSLSLETGSKSPLIIFPDTDIDSAVLEAHQTTFNNQGQTCCKPGLIYVHESIYNKFVDKSVELANKSIVLGNPYDSLTNFGPLIDGRQYEKVMSMIETGVREGARLLTGGKRWGTQGYYIEPTVFADIEDSHAIAREEIFGPVQCILKFSTIDEVIDRANNSDYGLNAGVFTDDINKALVVASELQVGKVAINMHRSFRVQMPFGGCKQSGFGRVFGKDCLREYLNVKSVIVKINDKNLLE